MVSSNQPPADNSGPYADSGDDPDSGDTVIRVRILVRNLEEYTRLLARSELVDAQRLWKLIGELPRETSRNLPAHRRLAQQLIELGLLTPWQDEQLMQGRWHGFHVGPYRLLDRIGHGGMGRVYLGEHTPSRRRVALKMLPLRWAQDPAILRRFEAECQAQAKLNHPNVVRLMDSGTINQVPYLALEYVPGLDFERFIADHGPMSAELAADTIRQAALGLQHLHDAGLIHRDIKPGNLMANQEGQVKLLDLGVARFVNEDELLMHVHQDCVIGTLDFLAPEQAIDSHNVDVRADLYALGGTLYFLLTGSVPFPLGTEAEKLLAHQTRQPRPIRELRPDVPEPLVELIDQLMAKSPDDRPDSAACVADRLAVWLRGSQRIHAPSELADTWASISSIQSDESTVWDGTTAMPTPSELRALDPPAAGTLNLGEGPFGEFPHDPSRSTNRD